MKAIEQSRTYASSRTDSIGDNIVGTAAFGTSENEARDVCRERTGEVLLLKNKSKI